MKPKPLQIVLGPGHVQFLLLALERMPCRGDEVLANVQCRQILAQVAEQMAPAQKSEAEPDASPDAVSQALKEIAEKPEHENRSARRRKEREGQKGK